MKLKNKLLTSLAVAASFGLVNVSPVNATNPEKTIERKFTYKETDSLKHVGYYQEKIPMYEETIEFKDTKKPNAVIIFPFKDWNGAFKDRGILTFYHKIEQEYDVFVKVASTEEDMYNAIDTIPNIELLVLGGHGNINVLWFDWKKKSEETDEKSYLSISDLELGDYLNELNPNAVILLYSCSNAKGGKNEINLANFVMSHANGRKVIASTKPFNSGGIEIISIYPLDIKIKNKFLFWNEDLTYTNK